MNPSKEQLMLDVLEMNTGKQIKRVLSRFFWGVF